MKIEEALEIISNTNFILVLRTRNKTKPLIWQ